MPGRRAPSLCVPVDGRSAAEVLSYRDRAPLLTIRAGRPALLVTLSVPDLVEAGHVEFARQLARSATAYAVAVERRFRRLPPLEPSRLADYRHTWPAVATLWADSRAAGTEVKS
jgi:hypothetical protein